MIHWMKRLTVPCLLFSVYVSYTFHVYYYFFMSLILFELYNHILLYTSMHTGKCDNNVNNVICYLIHCSLLFLQDILEILKHSFRKSFYTTCIVMSVASSNIQLHFIYCVTAHRNRCNFLANTNELMTCTHFVPIEGTDYLRSMVHSCLIFHEIYSWITNITYRITKKCFFCTTNAVTQLRM